MGKQTILIVDDSEMNRDLLVDILEDQYDLIEAENGVKAIEILAEQREAISLVLLDIMMPEMDGFGVLSHIYQNHWNESFAVIMISADDSPANIKRAYDLGAFDYISRPFDAAIVQRRISNTMCLYVRQKHLEQLVIEQFYENENNNKLMIAILSHIVEFRNGESGAHVLHVNQITELLLKQLILHTDRYSLSQSDIALISTASSLHDIGKIAISEEILNKPGRLTDEEFEIIKTHTAIGADMLLSLPADQQSVPLVRMAFEICRWHHERYDGKGYPDGLKGDDIPIAAQAVALADVYDALTSERCYKKAYSHEDALNMILDGQCGSFNPILLQCLQEITTVLKRELIKKVSGQTMMQRTGEEIDYGKIFSAKKYNFQSQQQKTWKLLYTDSLTGVYNRRYYDDYIQNAEDIQAAVMIDVDNFKHINDNYGHDAGDIVLHSIAQTILSCVRKTDAVIRYGGDEFAVIFYQIPEEVFETKLERMRYLVEDLRVKEYPEIRMSISVGGAYGTKRAKELFKIADRMMYRSKRTKNQVNICFLDKKAESV
ncbi:diguanylate cyclase [Lacrimispora sp. 210928-DFI.3.58]|uniref:diguanylate cyclase n=1 Tax=Lacrimispora sp. 210928-DFI.3.58 TaxID=2883214 RepID=UPI001D0969EE|nr:diguanylate cyclase [Lacrimispora sp. 210928-DFI.3.58]MCB7321117.1 diguanylate cyclase [Lacrimispora sp. 210928-DFI.3.58]